MCNSGTMGSVGLVNSEKKITDPLFKVLNIFGRPGGHSANEIFRDGESFNPIAIRCNCAKDTFHPVIGMKVLWDKTIPNPNPSRKVLKKMMRKIMNN